MRPLGDLLPYIHSYTKYLYLFELNTQKWLKINNEHINEKYVYHNRCIYCVYDVRERNYRQSIMPRCDADISTRSRFFKHLQDLETDLNMRLVCFEQEAQCFMTDEQCRIASTGELSKQTESNSEESYDSRDEFGNENEIDRFLAMICEQHKDRRQSSISSERVAQKSNHFEVNHDTEQTNSNFSTQSYSKIIDQIDLIDNDSNSNQTSTCNLVDDENNINSLKVVDNRTVTEKTSNFILDENSANNEDDLQTCYSSGESMSCSPESTESEGVLSQCTLNSLPITPPHREFKLKRPVVKSILTYEKEFEEESKYARTKKRLKYESNIRDYNVVVKQIIGDRTEFLCYLDQV